MSLNATSTRLSNTFRDGDSTSSLGSTEWLPGQAQHFCLLPAATKPQVPVDSISTDGCAEVPPEALEMGGSKKTDGSRCPFPV